MTVFIISQLPFGVYNSQCSLFEIIKKITSEPNCVHFYFGLNRF